MWHPPSTGAPGFESLAAGATLAITATFANPGDRVIVEHPNYPSTYEVARGLPGIRVVTDTVRLPAYGHHPRLVLPMSRGTRSRA